MKSPSKPHVQRGALAFSKIGCLFGRHLFSNVASLHGELQATSSRSPRPLGGLQAPSSRSPSKFVWASAHWVDGYARLEDVGSMLAFEHVANNKLPALSSHLLFVCLSLCLFVRSFVCLFIRLWVCLFFVFACMLDILWRLDPLVLLQVSTMLGEWSACSLWMHLMFAPSYVIPSLRFGGFCLSLYLYMFGTFI